MIGQLTPRKLFFIPLLGLILLSQPSVSHAWDIGKCNVSRPKPVAWGCQKHNQHSRRNIHRNRYSNQRVQSVLSRGRFVIVFDVGRNKY